MRGRQCELPIPTPNGIVREIYVKGESNSWVGRLPPPHFSKGFELGVGSWHLGVDLVTPELESLPQMLRRDLFRAVQIGDGA